MKLLLATITLFLATSASAAPVEKSVEKPIAPIPPAKPALIIVTRAVAEVADRVITSREVRISDAIEQAMTGKSPSSEGFRVLTGVEKNFPGEVTAILDE